MSDHQLSYLSAYFQGKFNFHDTFWDGFLISATKGRILTETERAQNALKKVCQKDKLCHVFKNISPSLVNNFEINNTLKFGRNLKFVENMTFQIVF